MYSVKLKQHYCMLCVSCVIDSFCTIFSFASSVIRPSDVDKQFHYILVVCAGFIENIFDRIHQVFISRTYSIGTCSQILEL